MKERIGSLRIVFTLVMVLLLATPMGSKAAQTQDFTPNSYTSVLSGFEITVSGPDFAIVDASLEHYRTGEGEIVSIDSGVAMVEVSFFDDEDTPDDSLDAYLDNIELAAQAFEVVDRAGDHDLYHVQATFTYDDVEMMMYAQITQDIVGNVDLFEMIIAEAEFFEEDLAIAQDEIEIDGLAFLADYNISTGGDDIDTGSGLSGNPREDARIGDGHTSVSTPDVGTDDTGAQGVLTDASWQGPVFGHVFGWNPDMWYVDPNQDGAIYASEEDGVDSITLSGNGWETTALAYIAVIDDPAHTAQDYLGYWSSDDYVLSVLIGSDDGEYEILSSRSRADGVGVVILYTANGREYVRINQMFELADGTLLMTQVDTTPDEIVEVYDTAMQDFTLDGEPLPQVLTTRQIERAVGE